MRRREIHCQLLYANGTVLPAQLITYADGEFGVKVPSPSTISPEEVIGILIDQERKVQVAFQGRTVMVLTDQGPATDNGPDPP